MSDRGETGGFNWEGAEDITALSEDELRERLETLVEEERAVSYRRRILHGRIDLIRAELVQRGAIVRSPEELVRALMGERRP
jgi:hypothetical protein